MYTHVDHDSAHRQPGATIAGLGSATGKLMIVLVLVLLVAGSTSAAGGRVAGYPRATVGIQLGYLGTAMENFDLIYGSNAGFSFGIESSLNLLPVGDRGRLYGVFQWHHFGKDGHTIGDYEVPTKWNQSIINLGARLSLSTGSRARAWGGGGLAFVSVSESIALYGVSDVSESTTGIYLESGGATSIGGPLELFLNAKIDFASVPNQGGVGSSGGSDVNVSTYAVAAGVNLAF